MLQIKFDCNRPAGLGDIHIWKCGCTHARTLARVPSYKLTLWAFGSGELKIQVSYFIMRNPYMKFQNPSMHGSQDTACIRFHSDFYTPPHKMWRGIMLYPPNFECPSIRLSDSASFPCSNFSTFRPIFFKLCIDIGIGEEWYGIASGLISFWNNRVMALDVCQKCFALRFRALTLVRFYRFSSNFA